MKVGTDRFQRWDLVHTVMNLTVL